MRKLSLLFLLSLPLSAQTITVRLTADLSNAVSIEYGFRDKHVNGIFAFPEKNTDGEVTGYTLFISEEPLPVIWPSATWGGTNGRWTVSRWPLNCSLRPGFGPAKRTATAGAGA